jgi:hypothetical protein
MNSEQPASTLVYVPLEDARLTALAQASEASGVSIEELVQGAVAEFLDARREEWLNSATRASQRESEPRRIEPGEFVERSPRWR